MKFKPAKLKLKNGDKIRIVAVTDESTGDVDIKVVNKDGSDVACGILAVITPDGLWRLGNIDEDIGLPLEGSDKLKICKE